VLLVPASLPVPRRFAFGRIRQVLVTVSRKPATTLSHPIPLPCRIALHVPSPLSFAFAFALVNLTLHALLFVAEDTPVLSFSCLPAPFRRGTLALYTWFAYRTVLYATHAQQKLQADSLSRLFFARTS
jgi:hypothetical protein